MDETPFEAAVRETAMLNAPQGGRPKDRSTPPNSSKYKQLIREGAEPIGMARGS